MSAAGRRLLSGLLPWLALGCGPREPDGPQGWFQEESRARGIDYRHVSGFAGRFLIPEITGSGAALTDLDGDGDLDVYIVQSGSVTAPSDVLDRVYLNMGDGRLQPGCHRTRTRANPAVISRSRTYFSHCGE